MLKVVCGKEIHIVNADQARTLSALRNNISRMFKQRPQQSYLTYFDTDGD